MVGLAHYGAPARVSLSRRSLRVSYQMLKNEDHFLQYEKLDECMMSDPVFLF